MESESVSLLRSDVAAMRGDIGKSRQDYSVLDARVDALENWRERYLAHDDQVVAKLFAKVDELTAALSEFRSNLSHLSGERAAERRVTMTIVSLLSALCGGLAANFLHISGH
jgi:ribosomal 50S subunit-associated protein YjgA (DUF615 family)